MKDLQQRVSAAKGPDRDLDAEISWRLTPEIPGRERGADADGRQPTGPEVFDELFPNWRAREDIVPRYTASLDAALALAGARAETALRQALDRQDRASLTLTVALALGVISHYLETF
jgi:hypothetical protein